MTELYGFLGYPLGWVMWLCYKIVPSYLAALVLFTVVTKLALLPLSIKQQKSTAKMAMIKPRMDELQKKYANNKQKLNEEMAKLYQEEKYNPASGCLPLLIQMPILFGLIDVIYRPLTHILRIPADVIASAELVTETLVNKDLGWMDSQVRIIQQVAEHPDAFFKEVEMFPEFINLVTSVDLTFMGTSLGETPTLAFPLIMIPILSGVTSVLLTLVTMRGSAMQANSQANTMMFIMPIFSVMIAFQVPAGVGFYWFISNVIAIIQAVLFNKFLNPKKMAAAALAEAEERRKLEREQKLELKALAREGDEEAKKKAMSQKQLNRQKLIEARKRDALKYGEEYVEDGGDDYDG